MRDRRYWPANARVAHESLRGAVEGLRFVRGEYRKIMVGHVDQCRAPDGARDLQMLFGQTFQVLDVQGGWAFGRGAVGDYVGYLPEAALGDGPAPDHRIGVPLAHIYSEPDIKSRETGLLSFFSQVRVVEEVGPFKALATGGYIATPHLVALGWRADDAAGVAEMFLGAPYLWGGNTAMGIDCSGLVQLALHAAGRACPRDSDVQRAELGRDIAPDARLQRGDLIFWQGHVGMMRDATTLIHANAFHMAVASEPLQDAMDRIAAREFGPVTARKRMGVDR